MRRILFAMLCTAALSGAAGIDSDGAEVLAPSAPKPDATTATQPSATTDSVITSKPSSEPSVSKAPIDSSVRDTAAAEIVVPAPAILVPSATVPSAAFAVQERADTTRRVVGPVRTISIAVDTIGSARNDRSTWAAVGLTLVLPGAGHQYLGRKTGAAIWMTADLVMWSALAVAWQMGSLYIEDATEIANRYAGASLGSDPEIAFLETMRDWRSRRPVSGRRDSYDEAMLQQGLAPDSRYPEDAAHDWDWGSPENSENNAHIAQFEDALKGYRTSRIALTYAAGALLVSRAIAVADILRIRRKSASRAGIHAMVVPRLDGGQALLAYCF